MLALVWLVKTSTFRGKLDGARSIKEHLNFHIFFCNAEEQQAQALQIMLLSVFKLCGGHCLTCLAESHSLDFTTVQCIQKTYFSSSWIHF